MRDARGGSRTTRAPRSRRGDHDAFAAALDAGYDVRASIFELDPRHAAIVERGARARRCRATYTGSGGAVVGIARDPAAVAALAARLEPEGIRLEPARTTQTAV